MSSRRSRHTPQRSCVVCRLKTAKSDLIRVVCTPQGSVEIDTTGKKSGRGAYLCKGEECWEQALKRKRLEYALRSTVPEEGWNELRAFAQTLISAA